MSHVDVRGGGEVNSVELEIGLRVPEGFFPEIVSGGSVKVAGA